MKIFLLSVLCMLLGVAGFGQSLYAPGGSANIQSSTTYAGIGTTAPLSLFHLQQPGSTWNDGLRLSLNGKDWNIVSTHSGARLALGFGQTAMMEFQSDGAKPTIHLQGDVTLKGKAVYFLGDAADPNYLIQSGLWSEGMMYKHYTSHRFFTNRREQMRIAFDGRIGINTTAPTGRLHVQQATAAWAEGIRLGFQAKNWDIVATSNGERLSIGAEESQGIELNSVAGAPAMAVKGTLEVRGDLQLGPRKAVYFLGSAADPEYLIQSGNWNEGMMYRHFTSHQFFTDRQERLRILKNGNVGIGTTSPDAMLTVKGDIHAREVRLDMVGSVAPDFVFAHDYKLLPLDSVEAFIAQNHHLPHVPSALQMDKAGIELKAFNLLLLQKIEELTLYTIDLKKEHQELTLYTTELKKEHEELALYTTELKKELEAVRRPSRKHRKEAKQGNR